MFGLEMAGIAGEEENAIWAALKEPLRSFVGGQQSNDEIDDNRHNRSESDAAKAERQVESSQRRYRKRIQSLQTEVEEVNKEATNTRKLLWEAQDKWKDTGDVIRQLENHLNEVLELREKDLLNIKTLRAANSDCVENENRAREAMEVFKKCYKRSQLKIKEHEEEIAVLREQRESSKRGNWLGARVIDTKGMVEESALKYVQTISNDKGKRLKEMLTETEAEVNLWKSKYKVAHKRCLNWQEQILAMEHPSEGAAHIKRQIVHIDELEAKIKSMEEKKAIEDSRNPFDITQYGIFSDDDIRDGLTRTLVDGFQNLNCSIPTSTPKFAI